MAWLRDLFTRRPRAPRETVERLTRRGLFRVEGESAALSDRETVRRWLRELREDRDQQVMVHRPWGTVAAVADGRHPVAVVMSDGEHSWSAAVPGAAGSAELTPDQIEHVMLEALNGPSRPQWPTWVELI
ncbi:MAG TPA: hypothetical protein VFY88_02965 [Intrasporangium sp.]|nr:hypothetical protein [Intrasporangium sp.]